MHHGGVTLLRARSGSAIVGNDPMTLQDALLSIAVSVAAGVLIGAERALRFKAENEARKLKLENRRLRNAEVTLQRQAQAREKETAHDATA